MTNGLTPGSLWELLRLAFPLILSSSFMTLQMTIDRILLGQDDSLAVGASIAACMGFWTPMTLFQQTTAYVSTFVAQYTGARRPERIGAAIWQAFYFALASSVVFVGLSLSAESLMAWGGHPPELQRLESTYFRILCYSALPLMIVSAVNGFFAGRGDSWTVMLIDAFGLAVNAPLAFAWINGLWGFPRLGIAGAGWATVCGSSAAALLGLMLLFRQRYREEFATLSSWRFDAELFGRLMKFGLPSGAQWALEGAAFTVFVILVGHLGAVPLAATGIAVTINLIALLPMLGVAQAVGILVGQRQGENRPDLAARSTWMGVRVAWGFMSSVALLFVLTPAIFVDLFQDHRHADQWAEVSALVTILLRFVAAYTLFDSLNLVFSFALRGAGDTRFVSMLGLGLPWPLMVLPTYLALDSAHGLYWAWGFATLYIILLAGCMLARFLGGQWRSMRVIETLPEDVTTAKPAADGNFVSAVINDKAS